MCHLRSFLRSFIAICEHCEMQSLLLETKVPSHHLLSWQSIDQCTCLNRLARSIFMYRSHATSSTNCYGPIHLLFHRFTCFSLTFHFRFTPVLLLFHAPCLLLTSFIYLIRDCAPHSVIVFNHDDSIPFPTPFAL